MKKILIFSLAYYPYVSGAEIAVKEITERISPKEIEFSMVTMRFSSTDTTQEKIGNVLVYRVGNNSSYISKILFIPRAAFLARRLHTEKKFDAWWALMSYMVWPIVLLRAVGFKLPYVLTLQDGDPFEHVFDRPMIRPFRPLLMSGFRHVKVVQVISQYLGTWARKTGYTGPIEVIPNGVEASLFGEKIEESKIESIKEQIGKKKGEVWLVHTGRLVKKNSLDTVIKALPLLPPHVHFVLIGDGVEKEALEGLVDELDVGDRVHFIGNIENKKLPTFLQACDIFIRPSLTEGLGTSFIEAMAAGLPVIATQEGGIADFLFDSKRNPSKNPTGFAVDVNSSKQIAQAVERILQNPEQTKKVIQNAKNLIKKKYDWDLISRDMQEKSFSRVFKTD